MWVGVQEEVFAEQPFGTPHLQLGLVGPDPLHLQKSFCLGSLGCGDAFKMQMLS